METTSLRPVSPLEETPESALPELLPLLGLDPEPEHPDSSEIAIVHAKASDRSFLHVFFMVIHPFF